MEGWKVKIAGYFSMTNKKAVYLYDFGINGSIAQFSKRYCQKMVRLVNRSDTASENPRPTPDPNGWAKKIHPFTKSRSPLKNLCENNSWNFFFALASFQNNSKKYRGLSENPEFFFRAGKKNPETIFWKSMYTHSPRKPEIFPTTQKTPQNPKFSDVIAIADNSRSSCSISLKKLK